MSHILITGGSRGIGAEAVRRFAALGHTVTFLYEQNHAAAQAVAAETGAKAICCDVADGAAQQQADGKQDEDEFFHICRSFR